MLLNRLRYNVQRKKDLLEEAVSNRNVINLLFQVRPLFVEGLFQTSFCQGRFLASQGCYDDDSTARILKGTKPSDLPVVQSDKFEFVVNTHTAKTLGLMSTASLLQSIAV